MEDYDEVIIKTVRDLFRSYPLVQIKKYLMTKEGEINEKDSELKSLILDKYTSLTHGFDGLEKISSNLKSLEETRDEFIKKLNEIDLGKIECSIQNIPFGNNLNNIIINNNEFKYEDIYEKIENFLKNKKYYECIEQMIIFHKYIKNVKNDFNEGINLKEKYYFLLVELFEGVLNKMIEDSMICEHIDEYKILLDNIFENLIKDNYEESMEYLIMVELFLKILYDKNIIKIMEDYFPVFKADDKKYFSLNILLKILFLKISQILYDISITSIELLFNDNMTERYYNLYETVMCIKLICDKYDEKKNMNDIGDNADLNKFYLFIKSEIDKNMNSLLVIPKNSFQKLYLYNTINFWNKLFSKSDSNNDPCINEQKLLEFLFIDKSVEQISNISSYMLNQYSFKNLFNLKILLKNKNIKSENDIYLSLKELHKINNEKIYKSKYSVLLQQKLHQFFSNINNTIYNNKENNIDSSNNIEYMNIIIKIISYEELIKIFNEFEFNDILLVIKDLIGKNQMNEFLKIKNYITNNFKMELMFELYLDEEQIKKYGENDTSEALNQLIETFYDYEIKENEHKINIYLNILDIYIIILKNYINNKENELSAINNIILNDIFILNNITINNQAKDDKMNTLSQLIQSIFKINLLNINKSTNNFKEYKIINDFFTKDNYITSKTDFFFDVNKYIINKQKKVEYLPIYANKLHVHMLNKSKIDYSERESNEISTCFIADYRIEENYLSLRQDNLNQNYNNGNNNGSKEDNKNMFGNITGKLFNLISDD